MKERLNDAKAYENSQYLKPSKNKSRALVSEIFLPVVGQLDVEISLHHNFSRLMYEQESRVLHLFEFSRMLYLSQLCGV